jgi:hypothetical protein
MSGEEDIRSRRLVPWFSNTNLQNLRRRIARLIEQRAKLMRDPIEKPADDNPHLMPILIELKNLSAAADNVAPELGDRAWSEQDELSLEPTPMDPSWIWNDSSTMDASWFTNRLYVDDLRSHPDDASRYKPPLDAYRDGDELWEFENPASRWYIDCVCIGAALVRDGKVVEEVIVITS